MFAYVLNNWRPVRSREACFLYPARCWGGTFLDLRNADASGDPALANAVDHRLNTNDYSPLGGATLGQDGGVQPRTAVVPRESVDSLPAPTEHSDLPALTIQQQALAVSGATPVATHGFTLSNDTTMPAGRPITLTPEIKKKICGAIHNGNYRNVAAQWAGVPLRTFHRWCQQGKKAESGPMHELWQSVLEAEKAAEIRVVGADDLKHAEWWLEHKFPTRWGRTYTLKQAELTRQVSDMQRQVDALVGSKKRRS